MVNPLGINGQSTPEKKGGKSIESSLDNNLPENSQENLDARLDHAIEETFPTSDPVSVTITKGPEPEGTDQGARSTSEGDQGGPPEQESTEQLLDQVREALYDVADQTSGAAREMYDRGEQYARQAREHYPEAERSIREGQRAVTQRVTGNPLLALLMAAVAGYALARLIHSGRQKRKADVPDYGRTDRGYAPHRDT
jgi:hypothetical protein